MESSELSGLGFLADISRALKMMPSWVMKRLQENHQEQRALLLAPDRLLLSFLFQSLSLLQETDGKYDIIIM